MTDQDIAETCLADLQRRADPDEYMHPMKGWKHVLDQARKAVVRGEEAAWATSLNPDLESLVTDIVVPRAIEMLADDLPD